MKTPRSVGLLGLLLAGAAVAQPNDTTDPFKTAEKLSPQESEAQARDYYNKMHDVQRRVLVLKSQAQRQKDVVKLTCVEDKLIQLRGHVALTDQALTGMDQAVASGDDSSRKHEFTRVAILYQKVLALGTEAEACVGEDVSYIGETKVDVVIDPSIPQEDPTEPQLPLPDVTRPPEASPFI